MKPRFNSGDSVLLLHGGMSQSEGFDGRLAPSVKGFKVHSYDRAGHGRSPDQPGSFHFDFQFEDFSMVEYYTILPTDVSNHFCPYIHISNNKESKLVHYTVEKNGELIIDRWLGIEGKYRFWDLVKYTLNDFIFLHDL